VRYWDLAATEDQLGITAAYTAGVLMGRQPDGKFVIGEVIRMRAEGQGVRRLIRDTAKDIDGPNVDIGFPQDPGQAGKVQAQDMVLMLAGYRARSVRESGDKMTRAEPLAAQAEGGNLLLVRGDWNKDFIEEATNFSPAAKFKDQIDAASGAFGMLLGGTVFTTPETQIAIDQKARVPEFWPRIAAIDISPSTVSLVWLASQPSTNTAYVYKAIAVPRREISYHAEDYPTTEMKHNPIALIDAEMPVVFIATKDSSYEKVVSNIQEVKARKGRVIAVVTEGDTLIPGMAEFVIEVPATTESLMPMVSVIPLQLLSYHIAVMRGCNVDQPRNLAKSVTVE
jgi:predicted phage terminase large subunit-like protein